MKLAREFLVDHCNKMGWPVEDETLIEVLVDSETVWEGEMVQHRWYLHHEAVKSVGGIFIKFTDYIITGDNSMDDMDLKYDLNKAKIVERKEREIIEVYYE